MSAQPAPAKPDEDLPNEDAMRTSMSRREEDGDGLDEEEEEEDEDFDFVVRPVPFRFKRFCYDGMEKSNREEIEKYARASSYATFADLHSLLDEEFGSLHQTHLLQNPVVKSMWWNDAAKLDQYAAETVAGKFGSEAIKNGVGHSLFQQQLHVKFLNLYGTRLFSLSQHRLMHAYAHRNKLDREGNPKEDGGEKKALEPVFQAPFNNLTYTYFSFALLDAQGHQVPLLAEMCDRHGVLYGFDKGVKSQVVGTVSDTHEDGVLVSVDLELLKKAVPSFNQYQPHGEFTASFLRHRQALLAARSFIMGCAVQGKLAQLNYMWLRKEDERQAKQSKLQQYGFQGLLELEKEAELKDHKDFGVNSTDHIEFREIISTLSAQQKLQIEIELGVAAAVGSIYAVVEHRPAELLHTLADLQPIAAREKFTELVKGKLSPSSSSSPALIPELQRIVNEYAGLLVLPFVAEEVSSDEASKQLWNKIAIVGDKRF